MSNNKLTFAEAKQILITDYLTSAGFEPAKVQGHDYWYNSPFREERTPSFKVNAKLNVWYDHGTGEGGTILDLGAKLNQCTLSEFIGRLSDQNVGVSLHRQPTIVTKPEKSLEVISVRELQSFDLIQYLRTRQIFGHIARAFCKEVDFRIRERSYKAIGFPNQAGAYELRNSWFKGSSSPKDISLIDNKAGRISIFEGFMDFLSLFQLEQKEFKALASDSDFLVLNSLRLLDRSFPLLKSYKEVNLFLDNDLAAKESKERLTKFGIQFNDVSPLYAGSKDLNEYLIATGEIKQDRSLGKTRSKRFRR